MLVLLQTPRTTFHANARSGKKQKGGWERKGLNGGVLDWSLLGGVRDVIGWISVTQGT